MSLEISACKICNKIPTIRGSYSSNLISHKCCDINTGWSNRTEVINRWNVENSQNTKEEKQNSPQQTKATIALQEVIEQYDKNNSHFRKWFHYNYTRLSEIAQQ